MRKRWQSAHLNCPKLFTQLVLNRLSLKTSFEAHLHRSNICWGYDKQLWLKCHYYNKVWLNIRFTRHFKITSVVCSLWIFLTKLICRTDVPLHSSTPLKSGRGVHFEFQREWHSGRFYGKFFNSLQNLKTRIMNQQHHLMVNIGKKNRSEANMFNVNLCHCSRTIYLNVYINKINTEWNKFNT